MDPTDNPVATIVSRVVPFFFGCVGVTVLVFLWSQPFGGFGSPPLFFRVFGSFIAIMFCLVGFGGAIFGGRMMNQVKARGRQLRRSRRDLEHERDVAPPKVGYDCPNCGGGLGDDADVSPSGDVKCSYCDRWFNIHKAG